MTALLPEGFRDALPPHADAAAALESRLLEAARLHGYERVDPPLAENAAALESRLKAGRRTDAVRFVDPISQETLAIRPDLTAQVARIATTRMGHHPRPLRLCYAGSALKLRGNQLAPLRERRQVGAELIGLDTVAAAREVVMVAVEALAGLGAGTVLIDFTLPDLIETLAAGSMPVADVAVLRERLDAKDAGGVAATAPAYLPLIEATGPFDRALARLRKFDATGALTSRLDGLAAIAASLAGAVTLTLDPTERHGFEFQSWFGFSLFVAGEGSGHEVGRGGTYAILGEDGGEEPATGFSLYLDALAGNLPAPERRRLFLPLGTPAAAAQALRRDGWVTVAALADGDSPEAQLATHVWREGRAAPIG